MNTPEKQWWVAQAGEYVLGTLGYADWVTFQKAIEHDEAARQLVVEWERNLQPLADLLSPMKPDERVWISIDKRLFGDRANEAVVTRLLDQNNETAKLEKSVDRWRGYAGLATAASILLASLAWVSHLNVRQLVPSESEISVTKFDAISVIQDEDATPLWVVDAALADGFVRVTAIAPPIIDSLQVYELWIVKPDNAGVQSMGLIPHSTEQSLVMKVAAVDEAPIAFAVSLEPVGGSPLDVPSGPVLYQGSFQNLNQ